MSQPAADLVFSSATELAQAIKQGAASAVEVVEAHLAQIRQRNPDLNAIVTLDEEGALRRAREADVALAHEELWGPLAERDRLIQALESFLEPWDAWLLPAASTPAFPHLPIRDDLQRASANIDVNGQPVPYSLATAGHSNPFNLTGSPAVVAPAGRSSAGLPIGIQLVGKRWRDMELLTVARSIRMLC